MFPLTIIKGGSQHLDKVSPKKKNEIIDNERWGNKKTNKSKKHKTYIF